jgi:protocatechuate 3,4-dioxygenase alpha subunit
MKPYNPMMIQSPSQTVGPYFAQGLLREGDSVFTNVLVSEKTQGERIRIIGCVTDGEGNPIEDALIEIWQANTHGRYHHPMDEQDLPADPEFRGHGRTATATSGNYWFETIKPGSVPGPNDTTQAPHINVIVFARGVLSHAFTRIYFEDETAANRKDPVLMSIDDAARRNTLIAGRENAEGQVIYRFDIHLQGENETAFFDA